jgi:hypothetical protein
VSEFFNYGNLADRAALYFDFFNPSYLFMSGGIKLVSSTRLAGVFLMPCALFIPVGIYQLLRHRRTALGVAIVAGFATAPVAALLVPEHGAIERELGVLPFGVLLAAIGIRHLWSAPLNVRLRPFIAPVAFAGVSFGLSYAAWTLYRGGYVSRMTPPLVIVSVLLYAVAANADLTRRWRPITASLLLVSILQFLWFYRDYLTGYAVRSAGWFEFNQRGAIEAILAREDRQLPVRVFVSDKIQYAESYWRLYTAVARRDDLRSAMTLFDPSTAQIGRIPNHALVLMSAAEPGVSDHGFAAQPGLMLVDEIREPGGSNPSFVVLEKRQIEAGGAGSTSSPR